MTPFFAYPAHSRKVTYTTNVVESLNMSLRKVIQHQAIVSDSGSGAEAVVLGAGTYRDWNAALQHFAILFGDRVPTAG